MKEKFLVIGGLGHIGFNVVRALLNQNKKVKVLINKKKYENKLSKQVEICYGDITKKESLDDFFNEDKKTIMYVINCTNYYSYLEKDFKKIKNVNVVGLKNIVEKCEEVNIDKFIHITSYEAFNSESITYYGKCKKEGNEIVNSSNINTSTIVVPVVMGPHDYSKNIANNFLYNYYIGSLKAFVDGKIDIVDVRDVANAVVNAALYGINKKTYYLTKEKVETKKIVKEFAKISNIKPINKFYTIDKLLKKEKSVIKKCENKNIKPIYNENLLSCLTFDIMLNNTDSVNELNFSCRPVNQTLNDTKLFLDSLNDF